MASQNHFDTLIQLGFEAEKAKRALKATKEVGIEAALDWLEKYGDQPIQQEEEEDNQVELENQVKLGSFSVRVDQNGNTIEMAKGLKCSTCEKLFKNQPLASYHSDKSGHVDFEEMEYEVKPLTEEEKQERLDKIREQMKLKRLAKQKLEAEEAKANEAIRRKGGKDMNQIKEELKRKEMQKEIEQRKKDKLEEQKARARVKAEIEEDKKERARKAALEKSKRSGIPPPEDAPPTSATTTSKTSQSNASSSSTKKDYQEGRFQLRLPGPQGGVIIISLQADKTLSDLRDQLVNHPKVAPNINLNYRCIRFSTTYPRKIFSLDEMSKSIKELGLLPSVALAVAYE